MELHTEIPNTLFYTKIRGAIDISDEIKEDQRYLSGYFLQEYTKQISPQVAQILNTNVSRLKRRGEFSVNQYLRYNVAIPYNGIWYFRTKLSMSNYFLTVWCTCRSDKPFDPWSVDESVSLTFEVALSLPQSVREKSCEHILTRPKKDEAAKLEDEQLYNKAIKDTRDDAYWVEFFTKLLN